MTSDASAAVWQLAKLRDVTEDVKSWNPSAEPEFTYVDISSIDNERCEIVGARRLPGSKAPSRARRPIQTGDIVFSNVRTYLRNVAQVRGLQPPAVASTGFTVLRPTHDIDSRYLYHLTRSDFFINQVTPEQTGTHYPATSDRVVREQNIPLPDLQTQKALADLIDRLETTRMSSVAHIAAARSALVQFRQAVLLAACSGRLTLDWRLEDQASALAVGSASDVLPDTWRKCSIGDVARVMLGGTPSRQEPSYWQDGAIPWVSSGEVANGRISSTRELITQRGLEQSSAKLYPVGTVLIAMIGEGKTRGQAAILDIEASTNQNVAGILPNRELIEPDYLWRWALEQYETTRAVGRGGNQPALNGQKVRELVIPVPPLGEQREVTRRVDLLLSLADSITDRLETAAFSIDEVSRTVLSKAFRGDLLAGVTH
jgi:type I restriction enzyme, S subunit